MHLLPTKMKKELTVEEAIKILKKTIKEKPENGFVAEANRKRNKNNKKTKAF